MTTPAEIAALAHFKATTPFLIAELDRIKSVLVQAQAAETMNGFIGTVLDLNGKLYDVGGDIASLVRMAQRARA